MRRAISVALGALVLSVPAGVGCAGGTHLQAHCHIVAADADHGGVPAGWEYERGVWYSRDASGEHVTGYALTEDSTVYASARCARSGGAS